jgi:hypothetical protein
VDSPTDEHGETGGRDNDEIGGRGAEGSRIAAKMVQPLGCVHMHHRNAAAKRSAWMDQSFVQANLSACSHTIRRYRDCEYRRLGKCNL